MSKTTQSSHAIQPLKVTKKATSTAGSSWTTGKRGGSDAHRTRVDLETISRLSVLLDRLKRSDGWIESTDDLINKTLYAPSVSPFQDNSGEESISRAERAVEEVASMKTALQKLSSCIETAHSEATRRLHRQRYGSLLIPDEILSRILLFAANCNPDHVFHCGKAHEEIFCAFQSTVTHSHVCRRFRLVSLETPWLWNRICDSMSPSVVEICLKRSGVMPLEVILSPFGWTNLKFNRLFKNFMQAIYGSNGRWATFTLYKAKSPDSRALSESLEAIEEKFGDLQAPQLESLEIHIPPRMWRNEMRLSTITRPFYTSWKLPKLHTLVASQFVPQPFSEPTMLRILDLTLGDLSRSTLIRRETLDIEALHRFLVSCPLLEDLRLSMGRVVEPEVIVSHNQAPTLLCVKTLSLGFHSCSASLIRAVLGITSYPAASKLSLSFGLGLTYSHELHDAVYAVFSGFAGERFSCLVNLELDVESSHRSGEPIYVPFSLLEKIRHLTLSVDKHVVLQHPKGRVPPLRSLWLKGFSNPGVDWVDGFLGALTEQGDLQSLKEIRLGTESCTISDVNILEVPEVQNLTSG